MAQRKRTDNSKRQQPVQQQRAEAARQALGKRGKSTERSAEARSAERDAGS